MSGKTVRPVLLDEDYRALFDSIDQGFCVIEMIFDHQDLPVDYRFLEINAAFEKQTGLHDAVGRLVRDLVPEHDQHWFEIYGRIAKSGQPERFTNEATQLDRWYDVYAFRIGNPEGHRVAVFFQDITERKRTAENERLAGERDLFWARFNDTIRPIADPVRIEVEATRVLGEHLRANRVVYSEVDGDWAADQADFVDGVDSLGNDRYALSAYGPGVIEQLRSGRPYVIDDIGALDLSPGEKAEYEKASIRSAIRVAIVKGGQMVALLGVHQAIPRRWTEQEVSIVQETAQQTWSAAERARAEAALVSSERRLRLATEAADVFSWEVDLGTGTFRSSENVEEILGFRPETLQEAWEMVHPEDIQGVQREYERALKSGEEFSAEYRMIDPEGIRERWVFTILTAVPGNGQESARLYGFTQDITDRKQTEGLAARAADRDRFRSALENEIRFLTDPLDIQDRAAALLGNHLGATRAFYAEAENDGQYVVIHRDYHRDVPSAVGRYQIGDFGRTVADAFRVGRNLVVDDVALDEAMTDEEWEAFEAAAVRAHVTVCLLKNERMVAFLGVRQATPRTWTASEVALIEETAERTWAAVERARAEGALSKSEEKYRSLFNSMDQGFCVVKVFFNEDEKPVDYLFLETNPVFEEQTGLKNANGRTARELVPDLEERWFEIYGKVALTGESIRFVEGSEVMGRWFDVYAFRLGAPENRQVAILFTDISVRKRAEEIERATSDNNRFRVELADALRSLADPAAIKAEASRVLGKHLQANRVAYAEFDGDWIVIPVDYVDGLSSIAPGRYRFVEIRQSIEPELSSGHAVAISDTESIEAGEAERASYAAMSIRALLAVPLVKDGRLVAVLFAHQAQPRAWTKRDLALVEDTAERTWAAVERAKVEEALRESEERLRIATQAAAIYNWEVVPSAGTFEAPANASAIISFPMPPDLAGAWAAVHPDDIAGLRKAFERAIEEGGEFNREYRIQVPEGVDEVWAFSAGKLIPASGGLPARVVGVTQNITKRKRTEAKLRGKQIADREARGRAEFLTALMSELEAVESVDGRARRLVELIVPRIAAVASVVLPGQEPAIVSSGHGEPEIELPLPLGVNQVGSLRLGFMTGKAPSPEDLQFAREIAERAALLIGNARLQAEEHRIARGLQKALLPIEVLQSPEVSIVARYEAGSDGLDVGGDWYDSFALSNHKIGLAVGDVVGTGLEAAAAMGRIRTALVALASQTDSPGRLLAQLDEFVSGPNGSDFATACYAILDPTTGELHYASAAHPPVLLVTPRGETQWLDGGRSLPLGGASGDARPEASIFLEPGALLIFYSDGLVERRGESLSVGLDRLAKAARAHFEATISEICESLVDALGAGPAADDDTVIMCVRLVPANLRPFQRTFPARPEELSGLRVAVREWLGHQQIGEQEGFDLLLALGEACTNAIEHAYRNRPTADVEVEIRTDDRRLHVRVRDFGEWKEPAGSEDRRERGTNIMMKLTDDFRRDTGTSGTLVTFTVPATAKVSA